MLRLKFTLGLIGTMMIHFRTPDIRVDQCFSTFFATRHPWLDISIFGGTPRWQNRSKDQLIAVIGGTPGTISRHPG